MKQILQNRNYTATAFIVCDEQVLLHHHRKLGRWLPVGGHLDKNETPQEAIRREVMEEAGLEVELYCPRSLQVFEFARELIPPVTVLLEDVSPKQQNVDFVFFAQSDTRMFGPNASEEETLRWFSQKEVEQHGQLPEDVKQLALAALQLVKKG